MVSATRPHGGAASLVGWGLVGGRQSVANGKNKCQPTKCATYYYRVYPEAYSAAGKTWFGWWLVEHYFSYHIDCPDGCDSGEPARGRKDPPYFQMSYGSLDNIPDLVDPLVESPLPVQ